MSVRVFECVTLVASNDTTNGGQAFVSCYSDPVNLNDSECLSVQATVERVTATGNSAGRNPGDGGGLYVAGAATVTGGRYLRNRARNSGGGLWNSATGTIVVTRARIGRNRAPTGRNLFNAGGTFTVDDEDVPVGGE